MISVLYAVFVPGFASILLKRKKLQSVCSKLLNKTITLVFNIRICKWARFPPAMPIAVTELQCVRCAGLGPCGPRLGEGWAQWSTCALCLGSHANTFPSVLLPCRLCVLVASVFSAACTCKGSGVWVDDQASLTVTAVTCGPRFVSPMAVNDIDLTACLRDEKFLRMLLVIVVCHKRLTDFYKPK